MVGELNPLLANRASPLAMGDPSPSLPLVGPGTTRVYCVPGGEGQARE